MRRYSAAALAALVITLTAACAPEASEPPPPNLEEMSIQAAATITEADYMRRIGVIAHDSMRGRNTPSPELEATAEWIASEFRAMGLEPAGDDGTFIQRYSIADMRRRRSESDAQTEDPGTAPNVVGILRGSDPVLADEYVVYSAHMDHVGVRQPDAEGDSIWNGADDDASGTTGLIEIAEAFASMKIAPRRSILFLIVSGEEKGLWGSRYFAQNPTVPGENMVANLNADMIGRNWPDTIVAIGKEHSDLGATMNAVNEAHPELNMTAIDDIWPEEGFYSRSDHFNFARRGVPILFFFNGTHEDYHGRNDEVDRIDGDKATRISQLMFYLGWEIAQRTERPQWDPASREEIVTDPY